MGARTSLVAESRIYLPFQAQTCLARPSQHMTPVLHISENLQTQDESLCEIPESVSL